MRQLGGQRAGTAASDDEHRVIGKLRQRIGAVRSGATDGLDDLAACRVRLGAHFTINPKPFTRVGPACLQTKYSSSAM